MLLNTLDDLLTRDMPLAATSWNAKARTFEVVVSSGAGVERRDARGPYVERIDVNQDWSALKGAPVLDSHNRSSVAGILGSVVGVRVEGDKVLATVRMSTSPEGERAVQAALEGHLRGVSFGYRIDAAKESTETGKRVVTITKMTPVELSLVPVGADPLAKIRSGIMDPQTQDPPAVVDRAAINTEIRSIARLSGLPQSWTDAQIDGGSTVESARAAAFEALRVRSAAADSIRVATASIGGHDSTDPEWRTRTIGEALHVRMTGATPSEAARPFVGLSTVEIARDSLRAAGLSTTGSPATIMERALMTTSDLPAILGDSVNRTLRQAYAAAPSGLKRVARQSTARDFRAKHRIQLSSAPSLLPVNEAGEFHSGAIADSQESYRLGSYGRIIGFTRQAFVNDDIGALADLTRRMGVAAAAFEAQFLVDLVQANPNMSDTHAVFSTEHGNIAASGAAIGETTLSAARLAMRQQTEPGGQRIDATPKFLVVPPALETLAEKTVSAIQANQTADANPFSFLSIVVEPRLASATGWYLVADPAVIEGLEYAHLEGEPGPQTFSEVGFDVDGIRFKIRLDFGGAFVEPRGWYRNAGA